MRCLKRGLASKCHIMYILILFSELLYINTRAIWIRWGDTRMLPLSSRAMLMGSDVTMTVIWERSRGQQVTSIGQVIYRSENLSFGFKVTRGLLAEDVWEEAGAHHPHPPPRGLRPLLCPRLSEVWRLFEI